MKVVSKELDRLQQLAPSVAEYAITRNYLDWLLELPWSKSTTDNLELNAAKKLLDEQHYGLAKVKDFISPVGSKAGSLAILSVSLTLLGSSDE